MREPRPPSDTRSARWGLLVTALLASAVLMLIAWSSYARITEAQLTLARGQGEAMLTQVRSGLVPLGRPPTREDLAALVEEQESAGLRYLAIFGPERQILLEAGTPAAPVELAAGEGDVVLLQLPGAIRMIERPHAVRHRPLREGARARPLPEGRERPQAPPTVLVDFEPLVANALERGTLGTLAASGVAALGLVGAAIVFFRQMARRDRDSEREARERRLAALGTMSAVLAHELRNPLTALKGHAQLLVEQLEQGSRTHQKAVRIVASAQRIEDLTSTLLDFVRSGQLAREPADPRAIVRRAAEDAGIERVELHLDEAPATFPLDALRMEQVVTNLLRNAIEASPDGASVTLEATVDGGALVITVRDRGEGVPAGEEEAIFEAFHTTRTRGTGLGLAVSRRIVEMHGGTLEVSNHPGGGAVFRLVVPG